jgi:hypothetical protein
MCYYITAVLPSGTSQNAAQAIAERHGRNLKPLENAGVQRQLRSGELYCLTTAGHCDCDTSLGILTRKRSPHQSQTELKAKKLAALGWSSAKIERAMSQSAQAHERSAVRAKRSADADTEAWIPFIQELRTARVPYLGLLLHFYDGTLSQNIQFKDRILVSSTSQAREVLPRMAEDTLYEFRTEA